MNQGKENKAPFTRKYFYPVAIVFFLVYLALLLFRLDLYCFHQDEARYWLEIQNKLSGLIKWSIKDIHPPLYFILLKFWASVFGDSVVSLRVPSVLYALLSFIVFAALVRRFLDSRTAAVSLVFYSLLPYGIFCFRLAKYYSLVNLLSLVSVYFFLVYLYDEKPRLWVGLGYAFASALLLYTQYVGFIVLVSQAIIFIFVKGLKPYFKALFKYQLVTGLLFLPWALVFLTQLGSLVGVHEVTESGFSLKAPVVRLFYTFYAFLNGNTIEPRHWLIALFGALLLAASLVGSFLTLRKNLKNKASAPVLFFWLSLIFGLGMSLYFFLFVHFMFLPERFCFLLPFFAIVVSGGILFWKRIKIPLAICFVGIFTFSLYNYLGNREGTVWAYRINWHEIQKYIAGTGNKTVLFDNYHFGVLGKYYLDKDANLVHTWDWETSKALPNISESPLLKDGFCFVRSMRDVSEGGQIDKIVTRLKKRYKVKDSRSFVEDHPDLYRIKKKLQGGGEGSVRFKMEVLLFSSIFPRGAPDASP